MNWKTFGRHGHSFGRQPLFEVSPWKTSAWGFILLGRSILLLYLCKNVDILHLNMNTQNRDEELTCFGKGGKWDLACINTVTCMTEYLFHYFNGQMLYCYGKNRSRSSVLFCLLTWFRLGRMCFDRLDWTYLEIIIYRAMFSCAKPGIFQQFPKFVQIKWMWIRAAAPIFPRSLFNKMLLPDVMSDRQLGLVLVTKPVWNLDWTLSTVHRQYT